MRYLLLIIAMCLVSYVKAQEDSESKNKMKIGFNFGYGRQESFPFNSNNYSYDLRFYKIQLNYSLIDKRRWVFEINVEPSFYNNEHQLLNEFYVQPNFGDDFIEQRIEYVKKKQLNEYVLNIGFIARYKLLRKLSTYAIASIGPMYSDTNTERMKSGFAFSDILGLGLSYKIKNFYLDFRYSIRHVSNANLSLPNNGYNSSNLEIGFTYQL